VFWVRDRRIKVLVALSLAGQGDVGIEGLVVEEMEESEVVGSQPLPMENFFSARVMIW